MDRSGKLWLGTNPCCLISVGNILPQKPNPWPPCTTNTVAFDRVLAERLGYSLSAEEVSFEDISAASEPRRELLRDHRIADRWICRNILYSLDEETCQRQELSPSTALETSHLRSLLIFQCFRATPEPWQASSSYTKQTTFRRVSDIPGAFP